MTQSSAEDLGASVRDDPISNTAPIINKEIENQSESEGTQDFDFSSDYSDNIPKILKALNISLAVTSYQSARLMLLRSDGEQLDINFNQFPRPMGVYADAERITLGTLNQVIDLRRSDQLLQQVKAGKLDSEQGLAHKLKESDMKIAAELIEQREREVKNIKAADSLYIERAAMTTGMINIHDIAWGDKGLWVVNSTFSCLSTLRPDYSFVAHWQPPFISELVPEDRCHLNGMAMLNGKPRYVTTFCKGDKVDAWLERDDFEGTLIDVQSNKILIDNLVLPHSPRCHQGMVYVCNSGCGEILRYNPTKSEHEVFARLPGFTRGMHFLGDLMLVGLSKIRPSKRSKAIPLLDELGAENSRSGIWFLDANTGDELGHVRFNGDVEQIYDIAIIPNSACPELLQEGDALMRHLFEFTQEAF